MIKLEEFVNEKLKINKIDKYIYHPESKEELIDLIIKEIETNGYNCSLNHIDVSNISDMSYLFLGGEQTKYPNGHPVLSSFDGNISEWDVSNVTKMEYMFVYSKYSGKNGDISDWDVSNVIYMTGMFANSKYNGDISKWDVSSVKTMTDMFYRSKFNGDISKWDVSNVKWFIYTFKNSSFSGDISKWQINPKAKGHMNKIFKDSPLEFTPPDWYYIYA